MIRDYLKEHILITDGAMGTYYAQKAYNTVRFCELANTQDAELVETIHKEYIAAGAKLIRTNTFSVNTVTLNTSLKEVKSLIAKGYNIAVKAASGSDVFIAANIGPIPDASSERTEISHDVILQEYKVIVDTFLELGADFFNFETFSSLDYLREITQYIKAKKSSCFVLTQFALTVAGVTRTGISADRIISEVKAIDSIDAYGFNCGVGPTHLYNIMKKANIPGDIISVLPNAGYPEVINERTVYNQNPDYFAEIVINFKELGVKIIGGCCGTTPRHIEKLVKYLNVHKGVQPIKTNNDTYIQPREIVPNLFGNKIRKNKFVVAVELDPPFDADLEKVIESAKALKENGVDIITIADSPMGKVRADSMIVSAKIRREVGIETLPHICCRDRNLVSMRAGLLAAHMEGIRNILAITGDPVPEAIKSEVKSVFNINSFNLIKMISEMNRDVFKNDPFTIGGALNINAANINGELSRMQIKVEMGATFFLTQPVFSDAAIEALASIKRDKDIKILGGLMPIVTYRNAQFLNNELPGIKIPQEYVDRFALNMTRQEAEAAGIELAVEIANKMKKYVDGFYIITPFNRHEMIAKILKEII